MEKMKALSNKLGWKLIIELIQKQPKPEREIISYDSNEYWITLWICDDFIVKEIAKFDDDTLTNHFYNVHHNGEEYQLNILQEFAVGILLPGYKNEERSQVI